jgi:catechol 2,3-dioxygenase-like lactoylglutathione lyase family enzyme
MQRLHLHINVEDLERSIGFYSTLFGAPPTVRQPDYAKWMLDDPRVNLAISERGLVPGIAHAGIQADTAEELAAIATRLKEAGQSTFDQQATTCCYAKSDKSWVVDPSGVQWETFHTFGASTRYGEDAAEPAPVVAEQVMPTATACCGA